MAGVSPKISGDTRNHGARIFGIWLVLSAIGVFLVYFVLGPHLPPGTMTDQARGQQFDIKVLSAVATPVLLFVWVYMGYSISVWRVKKNESLTDGDGAHIMGNRKVQGWWYFITSVTVLSMAVFGTYELIVPAGAGGGEGPSPIWNPSSQKTLQVQVIAQQWRFTYRFPQFGGMETTSLELPLNTEVQFNVTSLDVIHDFWAYQLAVKADANPDVNNVAYAKPAELGRFTVRCDELCGIWHGAMYNYGTIVTPQQFNSWAKNLETQNAAVTKLLPKYATTYTPSYTGAGGGYYPSGDPNGNL